MRRLFLAAAFAVVPMLAQDVATVRLAIFAPDGVISSSNRGRSCSPKSRPRARAAGPPPGPRR
ncbi:MAG: hypothetical protein IPL96_07320 [Holophagaceae bacterium]|nr:hypothetical protein [Holophagaceae bacterium]